MQPSDSQISDYFVSYILLGTTNDQKIVNTNAIQVLLNTKFVILT